MKIVSQTSINKAVSSVAKMKEKALGKEIDVFAAEQPFVLAYLMAQEEDFSENDFNVLMHLSLIIYLSFKKEGIETRTLAEEEVVDLFEKQVEYLDRLEEMNEAALEAEMIDSMEQSKQPILLEYITVELSGIEESGEIEDEAGAAYFFPTLQLMVDMMDAAGGGAFLKIV